MVVLICNLHVGEHWALLTRGSRSTQRKTMFRKYKYGREPPRTQWHRLSCCEVTAQPHTSQSRSSYCSNYANMCFLQKPQSVRQLAGCQDCSEDPGYHREHKRRSETPDWIYICLSGIQDVMSLVWAHLSRQIHTAGSKAELKRQENM